MNYEAEVSIRDYRTSISLYVYLGALVRLLLQRFFVFDIWLAKNRCLLLAYAESQAFLSLWFHDPIRKNYRSGSDRPYSAGEGLRRVLPEMRTDNHQSIKQKPTIPICRIEGKVILRFFLRELTQSQTAEDLQSKKSYLMQANFLVAYW